MLYKVKIGRDEYLGRAEEVVAWMSRAKGAPSGGKGGVRAYMEGIAARAAERVDGATLDPSSHTAFLESLKDAGLAEVEERPEASSERLEPKEVFGGEARDAPLTLGEGVDLDDLDGGDLDL